EGRAHRPGTRQGLHLHRRAPRDRRRGPPHPSRGPQSRKRRHPRSRHPRNRRRRSLKAPSPSPLRGAGGEGGLPPLNPASRGGDGGPITSYAFAPMLDIRLLREQPEQAREAFRKLQADVDLDGVLALDERVRSLKNESQKLQAQQNRLSKEIGKA